MIDRHDLPDATHPAVPAATVLLLRDRPHGIEVLMIKRGSRTVFGGMWAFPGGVIEDDDIPVDTAPDPLPAARRAAVREAREEVALEIDEVSLTFWSHWLPPDISARRYSTWFFVAPATESHTVIGIDGDEVDDHQWIEPAAALELHRRAQIELAPPTMVTLAGLAAYHTAAQAIAGARPEYFVTRMLTGRNGVGLCVWDGDVAYAGGDAEASGPLHRVVMDNTNGWSYHDTRLRSSG